MPKYVNAKDILPPHLLREIQKYAEGKQIYIPKREENHLSWGEKSGYRRELSERNRHLRMQYARGHSVEDLAREFCLAEATVRKLVYGFNGGYVSSHDDGD